MTANNSPIPVSSLTEPEQDAVAGLSDAELAEHGIYREYCQAAVQKAGETPIDCGLEVPCPIHDEPQDDYGTSTCRWHGRVGYEHACRRPGETPMEFTSRYLGESRDV